MINKQLVSETAPWGLSIDEFFYFFMGLRKGEIRKQVRTLQERYPDESPHELARRCITAQWPLSLLGGVLLHVPALFPVLGPATKAVGIATGASVMIRLNMTLLLQIALLYGYDIDSRARLKEMVAIIAASGLNSSSSMFPHLLDLHRYYRALIGGATVMSANQVIGEAALLYYSHGRHAGRLSKKISGEHKTRQISTKERTVPVEKPTAAVMTRTVPVETPTAPVQKPTAPVKKRTAPVKKRTAPVKKRAAPAKKRTASVKKRTAAART